MTNVTLSRSTSTPTASTDWPADALSRKAIEALFSRMSAFYGTKFADLWRGVDVESVQRTWALELRSLTNAELRAGSAALITRQWPPTLPEFIALCRLPVNVDAALSEAIEQMPRRLEGEDRWSDPAIYWAASKVGHFAFRSLSRAELRSQFAAAFEQVKRQPSVAPVPPHCPQLPDVGGGVTDAETAKANLAVIRKMLAGAISVKPFNDEVPR